MRTVTVITKVYRFAELPEDAQATAVEQLRELLANGWDGYDSEQVVDAMVYTLADRFRTPGWDTYESGGISGVKVAGWEIGSYRGTDHLALAGRLDRDNAPALPWVDAVDCVRLTAERNSTGFEVIDSYAECECSAAYTGEPHHGDCPQVTWTPATDEEQVALCSVICDAIGDAVQAGFAEYEYQSSEERAREVADDYEFTADGHLYP